MILYFVSAWVTIISNTLLGGKQLSCNDVGLIETRLKHHQSYYGRSAARHVSGIEEDAHLPHRNLPG
jgi:hypothetical protein